MELTTEQRKDSVTAWGTLNSADAGFEGEDYGTAAAMFDRELATAPTHDPVSRQTAPDPATGRPLTTCHVCAVSWYSDYPEHLRHVATAGGAP